MVRMEPGAMRPAAPRYAPGVSMEGFADEFAAILSRQIDERG